LLPDKVATQAHHTASTLQTMSEARQEDASSQGIDITAALDILSQRQAHHHPHHHTSSHHVDFVLDNQQDHGGAGCACHQHGIENASELGQIIDMEGDGVGGGVDGSGAADTVKSTVVAATAADDVAATNGSSKERQKRLQLELENMTVYELIRYALRVQEDRVAAYRAYDQ
jgi:hypothetical protein